MPLVKDGQGNTHQAWRCDGYAECAYWAFAEYTSADGKETKHFCANCYRGLYRHDGWKQSSTDARQSEVIHP